MGVLRKMYPTKKELVTRKEFLDSMIDSLVKEQDNLLNELRKLREERNMVEVLLNFVEQYGDNNGNRS